MSDLAERVAELTNSRDRETLDASLVMALKDLLQPVSVAVYRSVGEPADLRWLRSARIGFGDPVATGEPPWTDVETLPRIGQALSREQAYRVRRIVNLHGPTHLCCFPIATDQEVVGVLEVETRSAMPTPTQRLVGTLLRIYRNFQSLLDDSEHDTLTGLLNRKTFDATFLRQTQTQTLTPPLTLAAAGAGVDDGRRTAEEHAGHWLGLIDIDHFSRVNDAHGRLMGDEVLLLMARLMRGTVRAHDHLYRFGGEQFVVLLRCGGARDAGQALERLRVAIESFEFPRVGPVTISIGYTEVMRGDAPAIAIGRADRAVRLAKALGRNCVQEYAEPGAPLTPAA